MCRYNQLWGFAIGAFGLGILTGIWLEGGFLCVCLGLALFSGGILLYRK